MIAPPVFASTQAYLARLGDLDFWWPYLAELLRRHGRLDAACQPQAGFNPTNPTFLYGDVVLKLFGHRPAWRTAHATERAAQRLVASDPQIAAPALVGTGSLFDDADSPWPYLITTRMSGVSASRAELSNEQRLALAVALGRQIRRVHALPTSSAATQADWPAVDVTSAARQSSLPPHLSAQAGEFLARLGPTDPVFVHGDLCAQHVFVDKGALSGIIDWGDAMATDRHYEVIQLHRDLFACDKALLRAFLDASDWPVAKDFAHKALGFALQRQAIGLAQHHAMDVFEPIAALFPLRDIATLDELATVLFAV